jgi:hypothetical protein
MLLKSVMDGSRWFAVGGREPQKRVGGSIKKGRAVTKRLATFVNH